MSKTKPRAGEMALEAQARILARFHFALVPSGVPFLGKAQHQLRKEVCTPLTPRRPSPRVGSFS